MDDFYEDDEPVEAILAILDRPADGVTTPPTPFGAAPVLTDNRVEPPQP